MAITAKMVFECIKKCVDQEEKLSMMIQPARKRFRDDHDTIISEEKSQSTAQEKAQHTLLV